jgi:hypothetical protein
MGRFDMYGGFMKAMLWIFSLCLLVGCAGDQKREEAAQEVAQEESTPMGTWFMYAGSETGIRSADDLDTELTVLVLSDSIYTLTLMEPDIQRNFVEKGQLVYDTRNDQMRFTVHSSTGVDFSGAEPRKLVDAGFLVPWEREPGTEYVALWRLEKQGDESGENVRDVMVLSIEGNEDSYFVRIENKDRAGGVVFDAKMKLGSK